MGGGGSGSRLPVRWPLARADGGRCFERAGPGPVLSYSPNEPFVLSGPKINQIKPNDRVTNQLVGQG